MKAEFEKAAIIKIQAAARAQAAVRCVQFEKVTIIKIQAAARAQVAMRRFQFEKAVLASWHQERKKMIANKAAKHLSGRKYHGEKKP